MTEGIYKEGIYKNVWEYSIQQEILTITGYTGNQSDIVIPRQIEGLPVSRIASNAFSHNCTLKTVIVPDTVIEIEFMAFSDCPNLTAVGLPDRVLAMGNGIFAGCTQLTTVKLPHNLTEIGFECFYECECLHRIELPEGLQVIDQSAFEGCTELLRVNFPDSLRYIGEDAFLFTNLLEADFGPNLCAVDDWAFAHCDLLQQVHFPASTEVIGSYAFTDCDALRIVSFRSKTCKIDDTAFDGCHYLTIYAPVGSTAEQYAREHGLTFHPLSADEPSDSPWLGGSLPDGTVEAVHYFGHSSIIAVPPELDGRKVTHIGPHCFSDWTPADPGDTDTDLIVLLPETIRSVDPRAFSRCPRMVNIEVDPANPCFRSHMGVLYDKKMTTLVRHPEGMHGWRYTIPESVTAIGPHAFENCTLEEFVLIDPLNTVSPKRSTVVCRGRLESIGKHAFEGCMYLQTLRLPVSVRHIGEYAMANCPDLLSFSIPHSLKMLEGHTFCNCLGLRRLFIPENFLLLDGDDLWGCSKLTDLVLLGKKTDLSLLDSQCRPELTVAAPRGSRAEVYARENGLIFYPLDLGDET